MVRELIKVDPMYKVVLQDELPLEDTPEFHYFAAHQDYYKDRKQKTFLDEFDRSLGGRMSKLVDYKNGNETILAQSVREVLGATKDMLSDNEAIRLVLDPSKNTLFGESLNLTTLSKLSRTLFHPHYTFRKKLSHAADSQDQRHRMTPASRPLMAAHATDEPDYITPILVEQDRGVKKYYDEVMAKTWDAMGRLRKLGAPEEFVMYLLPNAVSVRFTESSDLLNLHHKMSMRLCYLAQEEIWRASVDETEQILAVNPQIGQFLLPPCGIRHLADIRPYCPEGARFCGERVWTMQIKEYQRSI
jgi:hypothetical protein